MRSVNKKHCAFQNGFTLIELLTVAAIIGLLASVITLRVRKSQLDAYDSAIMQTFDALRSKAEIEHSENGSYSGICQEAGGAAGNSVLTAAGDYANVNKNVKQNNGGVDVACNESFGSAAFAAWTPLRATSGTYWCVDSKFNSSKIAGQPPADSTQCP